MKTSSLSRRDFLGSAALAASAAWVAALGQSIARAADGGSPLHLATNAYSWSVFYQREGRNFGADLEAGLGDVAASGLQGYEPGVGSVAEVEAMAPLLRKRGLEMRSIYVNSTLHTEEEAAKSQAHILTIARAAKAIGTRIIVTNPNPIQWGGAKDKSDAQLRTQAAAMDRLGGEIASLGMVLAYHNHDIELRQAAREFHHMMVGTNPEHVGLCLDAHWVYRGSGNSAVALFDILKLYGKRVRELHLRQSQQAVWSETLGPGDIDYEALAAEIQRLDVRPHLVLEIAVESGTPKTLNPVEAHRRSVEYARRVFAAVG
jgi:inosose dehydratase